MRVLMTCSAPALVRFSSYFRFADYSGVAVRPLVSTISVESRFPVSIISARPESHAREKHISLRRETIRIFRLGHLSTGLLSPPPVRVFASRPAFRFLGRRSLLELAMLAGAGLLLLASILHFTRRMFADALALGFCYDPGK